MQLQTALRLTFPKPQTTLINPCRVLLGFGLFVSILTLPNFVGAENVDEGWAQLLAHLATTDIRWGVDFIFPYGPYFDLVISPYEPGLFWHKYVIEIIGKTAVVLILLTFARRLPFVSGSLWLFGLAMINLALPLMIELYLLSATILAVLLVSRNPANEDAPLGIPNRQPGLLGMVSTSIFLAAVSLSKFTACSFSLAALTIISVALLVQKARLRALLPFTSYGIALASLFLLRGQHLADLPGFLRTGLAYSSAYSDGMAVEGPTLEVRLALVTLTLLAAAAISAGWVVIRSRLPPLAVIAILATLYWKIGFTRHDAHALAFFAVMLFLPALVAVTLKDAPRLKLRRGLLAAIIILNGAGFVHVLNREKIWSVTFGSNFFARWPSLLHDLTHPSELKERMSAHRAQLAARYALPRMRSIVGNSPLDMYTDWQGVALLNDFKLRPRPSLQSVNAVDPGWLDRNAAVLRNDHAPRFLLLNWFTPDLRYPTMTDGPALLAMLEHYDLRCEEKGYLLLERRPKPREVSSKTVLERDAMIDEVVELPPIMADEYRTLTVDVRFTPMGEIRKMAYRPPVLFFLVRDEAGVWHPFRLIAPMARVPFLLDPLCETTVDLRRLFETGSGRRVTALKLHVMRVERGFIEPRYALQLERRFSPRQTASDLVR